MEQCEILVVGAGPTGLVLALWLTRLGVKIRIVDRTAGPGTTSRALAVQARTLELYRQLDLTETVIAEGHQVPAMNLWVKGHAAARIAFENIGADLTPYPFLHIFPQDRHEQLLIERLHSLGVAVERLGAMLLGRHLFARVGVVGFESRRRRVPRVDAMDEEPGLALVPVAFLVG